jgi:hypothetical protein
MCNTRLLWCSLALLTTSGIAFGQAQRQAPTLVVNGRLGQASLVESNGHTYIDLEALARIANGSLSFGTNQIVLTIPPPTAAAAPAPPVDTPKPVDPTALSTNFMKAGIEVIALLREWASPVGYAIQNGYPIQEQWVSNYREQAANGLRLASVAATTPADKNALQLLTNEFDGVKRWSDKLVDASKNMNTAKYSMSPDSLRNEPDSQKLIACWRFLGTMLGGGTFQDDDSCH